MSSILPKYLSDALGQPPSRQHRSQRPTQFAINISDTATTLHATFPDLVDDIDFVLSTSLDQFEKDTINAQKYLVERVDFMVEWASEEDTYSDKCDATFNWAEEAMFENQLSDHGVIGGAGTIEVEGLDTEQLQKLGMRNILRFNRVVDKYRRQR